jgi:hypothetical protein
MNYFKTAALAVLGTVALTAGASAAVVCNEDGDCWRTKERLTYPPDARVQIYEDDYTLAPKYRWRDAREGRRLLSWRHLDRLLKMTGVSN